MTNNTKQLSRSIAASSITNSQVIGSKRGSQASMAKSPSQANNLNHLGFVIPKGYTQKEKRQVFYL